MSKKTRPRVLLVTRCFVVDDTGKLLVIKRSSTDKHDPGKWEIPGGKLEEGQDLAHSQEIEVMQEKGLLVMPRYQLVFADSFVVSEGQYAGLPYVVLFSVTERVGGKFKLSPEHTDHAWLSYNELLALDNLTLEVRKAAIVLESHLI